MIKEFWAHLHYIAHAHKRLFRSFRRKIWPRHSLRRLLFRIRQMYFNNRVTFTGCIRCFCATTSRDLVTLTFDLLTLTVFHTQYLSCPNHTPIFITLRLSVTELWITEFDHISVIRHCHCACAVSRDLWIGGPPKPHVTIFDPDLSIHYTTSMGLQWRLRVVYIRASPCKAIFSCKKTCPVKIGPRNDGFSEI